ncbi:amidohydrolase family protein [Nocardia sp. NPDC020380]|uniref:amidohydrolase family protein n=1 Tax=Nocardia sp. NPDC020380 TaxID=3364309 RepID=UPI003798587E
MFDIVIKNGLWFDGTGAAPVTRTLGIRDGKVAAVADGELDGGAGATVIEAAGQWVVPGFIDVHTHYDAEVLLAPGLRESVRHGVTTVVLGNCSLSTVYSDAEDAADLFSRVEAVPREFVVQALSEGKTWKTAAEYVEALESLPLGPNIALFLGHSDLRAHVMGLGRATDPDIAPTRDELDRMTTLLDEALEAGLLGMSSMEAAIDKLDGDRFRSRALPATFARTRELRALTRVLRKRDRVLQSAPNQMAPWTILRFFLESSALLRRRQVRTSLLTAADAKSMRGVHLLMGWGTRLMNTLVRSDVRLQHLPVPFELYSDGIDLPVFEEFGAGTAALHLRDQLARNELLADLEYRRGFRREFDHKRMPGLWHRDFHDAVIVECPDPAVIGKSFGQLATEQDIHPIDAFLDVLVEHGERNVRWHSVLANHRPKVLDKLATQPSVHMGFSDAGAHLRNMAFYNFGLRLLARALAAELAGRPFLALEQAVHRLTGELGAWFGVEAGTLRLGDRADFVVIDPAAFDGTLDAYHEERVPFYGGLSRMVNRNDAVVTATGINGRIVFRQGDFTDDYGVGARTGRFLKAA